MLKVAVVIPTYKEDLTPLEKISLAQCRKVLGRYPLIFFAPEGKIFSYFEPGDMVVHFPPQYFRSVETYCKLMLSPNFYETFKDFEYILIYQLDAFVFYDALEDFCLLGYDYIGAPWPYYSWRSFIHDKTPRVGNGGFSLRKVEKFYKIVKTFAASTKFRYVVEESMEDGFFAMCGTLNPEILKIAPVEVARAFSMEWYPDRHVKKLGNVLPFGCHNWNKFSADFYVELFAQLGYDLRPFRNQMDILDYNEQTKILLTDLALKRLIRRAERRQSISHFLPTKRFASVRVLRDSRAMKVLSQLIWEENSLTDKIFIYTDENGLDLLRDVERENLPHLILTLDDDDDLTDFIEGKGLSYGEHVVSFRREYLKHCEKLFHNLGK